jgi:hypothetical protein
MTFYPRARRRDICDGEDPRIMCTVRRSEVVNGSFYWDERRRGYCSTALPGILGLPTLLDACCFCHEILPGYEMRKRFEAKLAAEERPMKRLPPYSGPEGRNPGSDATAYLDDEDGN